MLDATVAALTGLVSVLTLALSRCRCIVRSTPEGHQWGFEFTEAELFPRTDGPGAAAGRETP